MLIDGLTPDALYTFAVVARNVNGDSPESTRSAPVTPQGCVLANAGPDQTVNRAIDPHECHSDGGGLHHDRCHVFQWTQMAPGRPLAPIGPSDRDKVTIIGPPPSRTTSCCRSTQYPMTNNPLLFRLTVTSAGVSKTDDVVVTPKPDQIQFATAKWKLGDFRVTGGGSTVGGTSPSIGTALVVPEWLPPP